MTQSSAPLDPEALLAHGDFVRGIARSLLFDEHAADDVVQQTWIAALGSPSGTSRGWLGAVARNLAIKRLRGDRRRTAREFAVARPEGIPSDEDVRDRERLRRSVVEAVLALDEPYRATVLLRWFDGLPPRDVAARMGVPVETVRTRTRRALGILRSRLDARHGDDRGRFCAGLAVWAGRGDGAAVTAAAGGGMVVGSNIAMAGVGVVVLAVGAWLLWSRDGGPPGPGAARVEIAVVSQGDTGAKRPPVTRKTATDRASDTNAVAAPVVAAPQASPAPLVVGGRVSYEDGTPVPGTEVWISTGEPGNEKAAIVRTGDDGRYESTTDSAAECQVHLSPMPDPRFSLKADAPQRVTPPRKDVDFVGTRHPTATLVLSVLDVDAGKPIVEQFSIATPGTTSKRTPRPFADGRVELLVRLASAAGSTVRVAVASGDSKAERDIALRENERVEVRLDLRRGDAVAGRVTDSAGRPLAGALVFFGEEDVGRGDEPFKPFDEKRVTGYARTGADGRFELRGEKRWVTVWHADASPVTVAASAASEVTLPARGTIRGVLRGADGAPVASSKVFLDRVRETTTDADGRFEFDKVEAGTRGLSLTGGKPKAYVAVRVSAGETSDVELRPGLPTVKIAWPGRQSLGRFVALVPLGVVGSMAAGQPDGGAVAVADVLPGRYLLLGEGGGVAAADVEGAETTAVVGTGEIVVRAKAKTRVFVVPAGSSYLTRLLAGRMAGAGVPADGVQRFTGLAPGRYDVGVERDGVRATVDVAETPVEVAID